MCSFPSIVLSFKLIGKVAVDSRKKLGVALKCNAGFLDDGPKYSDPGPEWADAGPQMLRCSDAGSSNQKILGLRSLVSSYIS